MQKTKLEIIPLNLEHLPMVQVAFHDLQNGIGKAHTDEGERDLGEAVNLAEFEECTGDRCWVLELSRHRGQLHALLQWDKARKLTVISV